MGGAEIKKVIDWRQIDMVLLDMDGTLLDLHFDNYFWLRYLPERYAAKHHISFEESAAELKARYRAQIGHLNWYCLNFWSQELELDILALKKDIQHLIAYRPKAEAFLAYLKQTGKQRILLTNAHPDALQLKLRQTRLSQQVDKLYSSHLFNLPKEDQQFWPRFIQKEPLALAHTLLIDDSEAVLDNARAFGFVHLLSVRQPDSQQVPKDMPNQYPALNCFSDILPQDGEPG